MEQEHITLTINGIENKYKIGESYVPTTYSSFSLGPTTITIGKEKYSVVCDLLCQEEIDEDGYLYDKVMPKIKYETTSDFNKNIIKIKKELYIFELDKLTKLEKISDEFNEENKKILLCSEKYEFNKDVLSLIKELIKEKDILI